MADVLAVRDEYRAQQWAMLLQECKVSGMTNKKFCEQRGVSEKSRFAQRMHGNLPAPVAAMLEKKHGCFDAQVHDIHVVSGETDLDAVVAQITMKEF